MPLPPFSLLKLSDISVAARACTLNNSNGGQMSICTETYAKAEAGNSMTVLNISIFVLLKLRNLKPNPPTPPKPSLASPDGYRHRSSTYPTVNADSTAAPSAHPPHWHLKKS